MKRAKITVIGAGNVGAAVANWAVAKDLGDVLLVDIVEGIPQGKALDLYEGTPVLNIDSRVKGTNNYEDTKDSDIVVITAGMPRKPGMSRDDLIMTNAKIVGSVVEQTIKYSPNSILVIVSNPLDAMVYVAYKKSGFPKNRVMGMAGVLDSTRFRSFIAEELDVSVNDVNAMVLGGHGDTMLPMTRLANVAGIPVKDLIGKERLAEIVERTRKGGGEFLPLLNTSAWTAPGISVVDMVEAIVKDKKRVIPCAAYVEGEYGVKDIFIGVPAKLGGNGVEEVLEIKMNEEEQAEFKKTVEHVQSLTQMLKEKVFNEGA